MKKKMKYETNPWPGDEPVFGKKADHLFPRPEAFKKERVAMELSAYLTPQEMREFRKKAEKMGLSPEALVAGILHDFMSGKLSAQRV